MGKKLISLISTEGLSKEEILEQATNAFDKFKKTIEQENPDNYLTPNEKAFNRFLKSIEFPDEEK